MIWIKFESENETVTRYYLEIIKCAFDMMGQTVMTVYKLEDIHITSGDIVVVSTAPDVLRVSRNRNIKVIFWTQGAWPEESYMRHSSKIRKYILEKIEKKALKRADFVFFVSKAMRLHFEEKYNIHFLDYYIMPCSNEEFHSKAFFNHKKYSENVFCYVGGTSVWQCFEETIELFSEIEKKYPESKLLLLVRDDKFAKHYLDKYGVKNYEIDFVPVSALEERLKSVKFGFLLRKQSVVNMVATPTKLGTYITNGIIPIFSDSLQGIAEILASTKYCVKYSNNLDISSLEELMIKNICNSDIYMEYRTLYYEKYAKEEHIKRIMEKFNNIGFVKNNNYNRIPR